jgi:energy-coupling factor transport system substrate-specific component
MSAALPVPRSTAPLLVVAGVLGAIAFTWPFVLTTTVAAPDTTLLTAALAGLVVVVVLAELTSGGMDTRTIAVLGVLSAAGAALRPLGTGIAGFEPVFFLLVLAGRAFGPGFGLALGATMLAASALVTGGVGPWLPYQMLGAAVVGAGAGLLPRCRGRIELALLSTYAFVAGLVYGLLLNLSFWPFALTGPMAIAFVPGDPVADNLRRFVAFTAATSLGFDVPRGLVTALLVALTGRRLLRSLRRAARRVVIVPTLATGEGATAPGSTTRVSAQRRATAPTTPA